MPYIRVTTRNKLPAWVRGSIGYCVSAIFLCLATFFSTSSLHAQHITSYNLNADNGLPSNHIYGMLTDHFGYLWIATEKGMVKYNGYTCKLFTAAEGLPTDDTWGLLEDKKGRIWAGSFSNEIGYIQNDKYKKINLKDIKGSLFPRHLNPFDSGIIFFSPYVNGSTMQTVCVEKNDTLYPYPLTHQTFNDNYDTFAVPCVYIDAKKNVYLHYSQSLYRLSKPEEIVRNKSNVQINKMPHSGVAIFDRFSDNVSVFFNNYLIAYKSNKQAKSIFIANLHTFVVDTISLEIFGVNEPVEFISYDISRARNNNIYVFTKTHIIVFNVDKEIKHVKTLNLQDIINNNEREKIILSYLNNNLWGTCIGTAKQGTFIDNNEKKQFRPVPSLDLNGYIKVSVLDDSVSTWWNADLKNVAFVSNSKIINKTLVAQQSVISKVIKYKPDSLLLVGSYNYMMSEKNFQFTRADDHIGLNIKDLRVEENGDLFITSRFGVFKIDKRYPSFSTTKFIDIDRYEEAVYDEIRKCYWLYNHNKIIICRGYDKEVLGSIPVPNTDKIERLCVDNKYGNVFIKTSTSLFLYNYEHKTFKRIEHNVNLKRADISVYKNLLVVYGEFGVLFSKIMGEGTISLPIIYPNYKKIFYTKYLDAAITANIVTLLTNKGVYEVDIPANEQFDTIKSTKDEEKQLMLYYNEIFIAYKKQDTINIAQNNRLLQLDMINPAGNGAIVYLYMPEGDTIWRKSAQGDVIIPQSYAPDNYYRISVKCMDDAWKSDVMAFTVYIQPHWWQTHTAQKIIWISSLLLGVLVIIVIVLITRRMVTKANEKKNMQMELELKAIYAQINPHFIFNTLTSALLLVSKNKMDEAYTHISKFSKLLRSYLKSSRNKFISIEEEIDNLSNYTELQQARFKDRFTCNITVDPNLNGRNLKIPSLLIQPFVENAINHGLLQTHKSGILDIAFYLKEKNRIICTITDNGIGRKQSRENKKDTESTLGSYGNLMIKDLINVFNKYEDMNIDIQYDDKKPPLTGTIVIITITNPRSI